LDKTVCELFAGVGGFRLGLERAGSWDVVWANQWEPGKSKQWAYDCYVSHFNKGTHTNIDIAQVNAEEIPNHTLLVGGFPCQDYSVARTQAEGIAGKKGVLWWEIHRIVKQKRPPFLLLENVDRLLKSPAKQRGRDFGVMLASLRDLGYMVEWRVLNAADYGFPQRRRRVFIFGFHNSTDFGQALLKTDSLSEWIHDYGFFQNEFPIEKNSKNATFVELGDDIVLVSDLFSFDFANAGVMRGSDIYTTKVAPIVHDTIPIEDILESNVAESYYIDSAELAKWKYMKGAKREKRTTRDGYEYQYSEGAIAFPDDIEKPARTMLTSEGTKNRSTHVILDSETQRLRTLTPVECERLNGFEDGWTDIGMPTRFRYFCMGNALVVGLVEKMGITLSDLVDLEVSKTSKNFATVTKS